MCVIMRTAKTSHASSWSIVWIKQLLIITGSSTTVNKGEAKKKKNKEKQNKIPLPPTPKKEREKKREKRRSQLIGPKR